LDKNETCFNKGDLENTDIRCVDYCSKHVCVFSLYNDTACSQHGVTATYYGKQTTGDVGFHTPWQSVYINNPNCTITLFVGLNFQMENETYKGAGCHRVSTDQTSALSIETDIPCLNQ